MWWMTWPARMKARALTVNGFPLAMPASLPGLGRKVTEERQGGEAGGAEILDVAGPRQRSAARGGGAVIWS